MKLIDEIVDKLKENDIKVFDSYPVEGYEHEHLIMARDMIIHFNDEKSSVSVSFHVATNPEDSAINILALREIDKIKEFYIMDSFAYTKDGKLLSGKQAHSRFSKIQTEKILDEFIKTQSEIQSLINLKGFEC